MIRIVFNRIEFPDGEPRFTGPEISVSVEGHSLFDAKGRDIVCAAVSALSQTLVLSLYRSASIQQSVTRDSGLLRSEILTENLDEGQMLQLKTLIHSFYIGITEIHNNYTDTIRIEWQGDHNGT